MQLYESEWLTPLRQQWRGPGRAVPALRGCFPASDRNGKGFCRKSWARSPTPFRRTVSSAYPDTNKTLRSGRSEARFLASLGPLILGVTTSVITRSIMLRPGFDLVEGFLAVRGRQHGVANRG